MAPHIAVDMSFDEFKTNKDPVLEAALAFNSDNFITNPMEYITELYEAGEVEKLQQETVRMINDPMYRFFDFESPPSAAVYG